MAVTSSPDARWIMRHAPMLERSLQRSDCILELGCGTGRDTIHLVRLGEVVAIDLSQSRLGDCRRRAPRARLVCADLGDALPLRTDTFPAVVASLSLHYFSWETTVRLVAEIRRIMMAGGLLVMRVNSTRDEHFGAVGYPELEPNFFDVDGQAKRFFDRQAIVDLFRDWSIEMLEEHAIMRYEQPKWVWEACIFAV